MDLLAEMPSLRSIMSKSPQTGVVEIPSSMTVLSRLSALMLRGASVSGHIDALQDLRSLARLQLAVLHIVEGDAEAFMATILGHTQVPDAHLLLSLLTLPCMTG